MAESGGPSPLLRGAGADFLTRSILASADRGCVRLPVGFQSWAIEEIDARQFECSGGIAAAAGIEFRPMVGKGQQLFTQELFKTHQRQSHLIPGIYESALRC